VTLGAFLFPSLFFLYAPSVEDSRIFMAMDIPVVDAYSGMELCTPIWLNHDYGDGGVVHISAVDAYSDVEVCTLIFLGEASK
jgi:hypothetical protein